MLAMVSEVPRIKMEDITKILILSLKKWEGREEWKNKNERTRSSAKAGLSIFISISIAICIDQYR